MYKTIVINATDHETRMALLEDGTISEILMERNDDSDIAGNLYNGRVQRVLPGMQAAFVDIGLNQAAFIYVDDIIDESSGDLEKVFTEDKVDFENIDEKEKKTTTSRNGQIEELIRDGQEMLVQVIKAPIGTKGARISTYISLPGRFLVLMPKSDHIGVSRRIEGEEERSRLKKCVGNLRTEPYGYIVRTAAEGVSESKFVYEMGFLNNMWQNIQKKAQTTSAPALLHQELNLTLRAVRDLLLHEAEKLVIDSRKGYESILEFLDTLMPSLKSSVELYDGVEPVFDAYNLEGDIFRAIKKKVWLKSGGYIVIEHTEALVAIDVNTGRYVGKHNLEETILKTNLEAVKEIAYQIRLRDLGGIIIIDFIDMERTVNREKVYKALKEALERDRSKTHVLPISDLGLIQMTRKRIRKSLSRILCEPCFYCNGEGYLVSRRTICYNISREIMREVADITGVRLTLRVNPEIAELLHGEENSIIVSLEKQIGKQVIIYPNSQFHMEEFDIFEMAQ